MSKHKIPIIGNLHDPDIMDKIEDAFRDPHVNMDRKRPYDGQPWTDSGIRGKEEIKGITFRDLRDCFVRAACLSCGPTNLAHYREADKGVAAKLNTDSLYELDWTKIDPVAVAQNLSCEVERLMGIFPNVREVKLTFEEDASDAH